MEGYFCQEKHVFRVLSLNKYKNLFNSSKQSNWVVWSKPPTKTQVWGFSVFLEKKNNNFPKLKQLYRPIFLFEFYLCFYIDSHHESLLSSLSMFNGSLFLLFSKETDPRKIFNPIICTCVLIHAYTEQTPTIMDLKYWALSRLPNKSVGSVRGRELYFSKAD